MLTASAAGLATRQPKRRSRSMNETLSSLAGSGLRRCGVAPVLMLIAHRTGHGVHGPPGAHRARPDPIGAGSGTSRGCPYPGERPCAPAPPWMHPTYRLGRWERAGATVCPVARCAHHGRDGVRPIGRAAAVAGQELFGSHHRLRRSCRVLEAGRTRPGTWSASSTRRSAPSPRSEPADMPAGRDAPRTDV